MLPNIILYSKAIVIKTEWHKNKQLDQWNEIESPEISPHHYSQLKFNRGWKHTQWAKNNLYNKWWWENWKDIYRKIK